MLLAPVLAEMALSFSTYENFWLAMLGLMCATLVARSSPIKAIAAMLLGLLITCIGIDNPGGVARFTFGSTDLLGGIAVIPALVGVFALAEVMRALTEREPPRLPHRRLGSILKGQIALTKQYPKQQARGNIVGIIIGVLPGAGADMAAWVSYAMAKRFSKTPEKFGTGHPEGLIEAGASNNASLASGWVPALLFGIPGDTITAIAIGVLYMKGLNPGPTLFSEQASSMYALYIIFILANIIMIPLGIIMIRLASRVVGAPRSAVMPVIMVFCAVGAFATAGNDLFAVYCVAVFGLIGFVMEKNGYPGRGDGARHRDGDDGRAELRDVADQVGRLDPALLQPAGLERAGGDDLRGAALAGLFLDAAEAEAPADGGGVEAARLHAVIPGQAEGLSPEPMNTASVILGRRSRCADPQITARTARVKPDA